MSDWKDADFETLFNSAAENAHRKAPRGEMPSSSVWCKIVSEQTGYVTADIRTNTVANRSTPINEAIHLRPTRFVSKGQTHTNYLHLASWFAVVVLIAAIAYGSYAISDNTTEPERHSIALAPSTPGANHKVEDQVTTPTASPGWNQFIPTYGPEFACNVEPLTADEVYQRVLNPYDIWFPEDSHEPQLLESTDYYLMQSIDVDAVDGFVENEDPAVTQPIIKAANTFWNCIMTGTAYQVWSLMDPFTVQFEVLRAFPVLRDETSLRNHIEEWGSRRYSAGLWMTFPDLGNVEQYQASMLADDSYGSIRLGYDSEGNLWKGAVRMVSHPNATYYQQLDLLISIDPDGVWRITGFHYYA